MLLVVTSWNLLLKYFNLLIYLLIYVHINNICNIIYKNLYWYQICLNYSRFYTGIAWHVLNYIYTRRVICTNKKHFICKKKKTFPWKDYMNAKHVQSQSTEKNSTNFLLKEQNLEAAIPWTTNNHFCIVMWKRCNSICCRVNMI